MFALGFQSLNVNNGHRWWAFFTSLLIGSANLVLYRRMPDASWSEIAAYLAGAPFGIISAMEFHQWLRHRRPAITREDFTEDELEHIFQKEIRSRRGLEQTKPTGNDWK